jgi:diacylglycerol kinase
MKINKNKLIKTTLSFKYAMEGIVYAFKTQRNFRIHSVVAILVLILSLLLRCNFQEIAVIVLSIGLVFSLELINTSIEATIDLVTPENKPLAKIAKDLAAAAVLVTALTAVIIGLLILGPKLYKLILTLFS